MVTAVRSGPQSETVFGSAAIAVAEPARRTHAPPACERCGTRLVLGYDEPECIACGWSDYSKTPVKSRSDHVLGAATRHILRYAGDFSTLTHILVHVRPRKVGQPGRLRRRLPLLQEADGGIVAVGQKARHPRAAVQVRRRSQDIPGAGQGKALRLALV